MIWKISGRSWKSCSAIQSGKDIVDEDDVAQICSVHTENKIFEMINNVAMKKQREALRLYDDLLTLKEPAMRILYLIARQFNTLLQIKELAVQGVFVPDNRRKDRNERVCRQKEYGTDEKIQH